MRKSARPCTTPCVSGSSAARRDSGSMLSLDCLRIPISTTTRSCLGKMPTAIRTSCTSIRTTCRRYTKPCGRCDELPGDPVLISEADEPNIIELTKMYGRKNDEIQLPMDFQIADVNKLSAPDFRKLLNEIDRNPAGGQPHYFFSNHDQPRQWDRYGDGVHNDQIAKLMAALLLTTRATPLMYYGEEIGMRTTDPVRKEDVQDPIGKIGWPQEKGRDGERTPMQ